jgi:hypothetical protein
VCANEEKTQFGKVTFLMRKCVVLPSHNHHMESFFFSLFYFPFSTLFNIFSHSFFLREHAIKDERALFIAKIREMYEKTTSSTSTGRHHNNT